jgi:hypothetical protein
VALFALQLLAIEWAPLARLLSTTRLTGADWLVLAFGVLWPVAVLEAVKVWGRVTTLGLVLPSDVAPRTARTPRKD